MSRVVKGVGGFEHARWRAFENQHAARAASRNFIDGDLVEQFLDLRCAPGVCVWDLLRPCGADLVEQFLDLRCAPGVCVCVSGTCCAPVGQTWWRSSWTSDTLVSFGSVWFGRC